MSSAYNWELYMKHFLKGPHCIFYNNTDRINILHMENEKVNQRDGENG